MVRYSSQLAAKGLSKGASRDQGGLLGTGRRWDCLEVRPRTDCELLLTVTYRFTMLLRLYPHIRNDIPCNFMYIYLSALAHFDF